MNYNYSLGNYCISSTGKSNYNLRIIKTSNQKQSNTSKVITTRVENKTKIIKK